MSEVADPSAESKTPTAYEPLEKGFYIVQIETHDPRVSTLFTSRAAKPPKFGIHDVTPTREFNFLNDLKYRAGKIEMGQTVDGAGTVITMAIDDLSADEVLELSSMTQSPEKREKPPGSIAEQLVGRPSLDTFRYRGSNHDFQRVSVREDATHSAVKGSVERAGQEVVTLIDLDYHR